MCLFVFTEIVNSILFGYSFGVYTVDFVFFPPSDRDFSFGSSFWNHILLNNIYTTHSTVLGIFVVEVHEAGYIHDTQYSLHLFRRGSV